MLETQGISPHEFKALGQVGQEAHRQPAVLETPSGVSGSVGRCRHMPLCPTLCVVWCRWLSLGVVGHWGRYWGRPKQLIIQIILGSLIREQVK